MNAQGAQADVDLSRVGFLVVDDKAMSREVVHAALAGRARSVRQTMSVEKALEILAQTDSIDCIIADWDMLPVGGLELLRMIRCRAVPNVPPRTHFVVLTARAEEAAVRCAVELDVNGFAAAPLSLDKLAKTVSAAIHRTWLLQDVAHYASVPCVVPSPLPAEPSGVRHPRTLLPAASRTSPFLHVQRLSAKRANTLRMCGLNDIRPGSVLARDIRDIHGTLLLRTGTALDPAILDRLRKAAGAGAAQYQVWVRY